MVLVLGIYSPTKAVAVEKPVMIFAAASLILPLQEFAKDRNVRISFAASSSLARQIYNGAPADIFISANERWMDWLQKKNRINKSSRQIIASNSLVLASPIGAGTRISNLTLDVLLSTMAGRRLAIADPAHVPAGIYAKQALVNLGLWKVIKNKLAPMTNVRTALAIIERREAFAGIVYSTDAGLSQKVAVLYNFPPLSHEPIIYVAATVAKKPRDSVKNIAAAILSKPTRLIFKAHGFLVD